MMMRLSWSRICRVINCRRRTTRGCKEAGDERGTDGVRRGCEGGAEGVRRGAAEGVLQRGADRVPRGTEREGSAGVEAQMGCMDLLVLLEFLGRCPNALHNVLQTVRSSRWARSGAAHCGQEPWHMGVEGGEAAGRETRSSNGDGESTGVQEQLPHSHQVMARMRCVGAPERWPLGPLQICGEGSHCSGLFWLPSRPWSTCAPQCWPPRQP